MKLSEFDFSVPEHLVAQVPSSLRGGSRLLVSGEASEKHHPFSDLPKVFNNLKCQSGVSRILVVVNDSRVYPARLRFETQHGGQGEVFVLDPYAPVEKVPCLIRPLKKRRIGEVLFCARSSTPFAEVVSLDPPLVRFLESEKTTLQILLHSGEMPLPPYLKRTTSSAEELKELDSERYQSVYASNDVGSAAAPTAGLHFTQEIMEECKQVGCEFVNVTLHVGLGTFLPVQSENVEDHSMHAETCFVSESAAIKLKQAYEARRSGDCSTAVVLVGTTALRTVETFFNLHAPANQGFQTSLYLFPKAGKTHKPHLCDALLTNFHQPGSSLVLLVAALLGERWRRVYSTAIEQSYRFFSYGDSSLLLLKDGVFARCLV
jgi:S-adenosylmethionine:tRNA ribosyltransferase-isomerase